MHPAPALPLLIARYPRLSALLFGALAATGFPPLNLWPLALVGMGGLVHLAACAETPRRAALLGWLFGVGHFTLANNWIATAFTFQAEMPVWLGWVAVPLLSLYLAVYPALAAWLVRKLGKGEAHGMEAVEAARALEGDVAYIDPPYNQHSYLGNYHIWESLVRWDKPEVYGVACKRVDVRERKSAFNSRPKFAGAMRELLGAVRAPVLIVSSPWPP